MKLIYFILFICWASARPLTRSKVKSAVDFQDVTLDSIAEIDYADDPTSYRKLTLAEMALDFAAFDSEEDNYEGANPTVMTARMTKKRKGGHGRHSHENGRKRPGHHHHSHERKHGHGHHHGHHHRGKHSHETGSD